jgi:methylglutaconyl-CoA hydratase
MSIILSEITDSIGTITLNRPEKKNALNDEMVSSLFQLLQSWEDNHYLKLIILKGSGHAFCAGADLGYLQQLQKNSFEENLTDSTNLMELFKLIHRFPKPIIAQIDGPALAGGCGLATICDFAVATENSIFGYTEAKIGFVPAIVMVFLIKKIGEGKARELLLSGEIITAQQAKEYGLISQVVNPRNLEEEVNKLAEKLIKNNSGQSMGMIKEMLHNIPSEYEKALTYAAEMNAKARATEDCKKGIQAFISKEKISWE